MKPLLLAILSLLTPLVFAQQQSSDIAITLEPLTRPASGTSSTLQATLRNRTGAAIEDIDVDFVLTAARATLTAAPHPAWPANQWACTQVNPQSVRCRVDIASGPDQFIPLMLTVDPVVEGRFGLTARAAWTAGGVAKTSEPYRVGLVLPRELLVANTLDAGPGSLREAIETLNGTCARDQVPCTVRFAIGEPLPQNGWYAIRPLTPLPAITSPDFEIDGGRVGGVRPTLELDGSLLATGTGLDIRGEGPAEVRGLVVGGFPWDGIRVSRRGDAAGAVSTTIRNCLIGVHPDLEPNGNGSRGVTLDAPASNVRLDGNLIAANRRSGVFIAGASAVTLNQDAIGSLSAERSPLSNGASGVYVGPGSRDVEIVNSSIVGNAHFGIAVARGAAGVRLVSTNRILNNGILPLDHGLDGFSGYARGADAAVDRPPAPRIVSVRYDAAADATTIEGTFDVPDPSAQWTITLLSPPNVWTDLLLPTAPVRDGAFALTFHGRPNGRTEYTAYANSDDPAWSTSEFAESVFLP